MEFVGIGHAITEQLLHFLYSGVYVGAELGGSLFALVFALGDVFVGGGLGDAGVLAFVDFELKFHVDILEEVVKLLDFSLMVFFEFFLGFFGRGVVQGFFDGVVFGSFGGREDIHSIKYLR